MTRINEPSAYAAAQAAIARALQALETQTGQAVDSITIDTIDVTSLSHESPQLVRTVHIRMGAKPGAGWSVD